MINYRIGFNKINKLPDKLIYHKVQTYSTGSSEDVFTIFFTRDCKKQAVMYCVPSEVFRKDLGYVKSLSVEFICNLSKQHMGLGRSLIEFAKNYSRKIGCGGRVNLYAVKGKSYKEYPHMFYHKCGFNTGISLFDNKMTRYIRKKVKPEDAKFPTLQMFYPPIANVEPKPRFYEKIMKLFSSK